MVARWAHLARESDTVLDGDFRKKMTGLILIDELDLHLHPRWQVDVVTRLREAFPRLSFVATTHNPLTLRGAMQGEIQVLERAEDRTVARQIDVRPGLRADELLTGSWFGLRHTLDDDTVGLMERYQALLVEAPDDPEIKGIEEELRGRLGTFAETREERMALKMVAEASRTRSLDEVERSDLKLKMDKLMKGGS